MERALLEHALSIASRAVALIAATMVLVDRRRGAHRSDRGRERQGEGSRPAP